ncbi:MAG: cation diffusion facilitator family transporter [Actinobacteria bacterium]|nr:cation diffusion facilitator family transporter [Actinomycetota bacterium]MCL6094662.1 cation diffusion facilitator family transporter [Actinomycetota bacterium]
MAIAFRHPETTSHRGKLRIAQLSFKSLRSVVDPWRTHWRLLVAACINFALVGVEVAYGLLGHSEALLADAGHNLGDLAAILLALTAAKWALRPRTTLRSFGYYRGTILAALGNSAMMIAATALIVAGSIWHLLHPQVVDASSVIAVASVAFLANIGAALLLIPRSKDLNATTIFWHMAGDVATSAAVALSGVVILLTGGLYQIDPAVSMGISILIAWQAWRLLRASIDVLLESVPSDIDLHSLESAMMTMPRVAEVHDLHVWSLSSDVRALSAHLVLQGHPSLEEAQAIGDQVRENIEKTFSIAHSTLELECERCSDDPNDPCYIDRTSSPPHEGARLSNGIASEGAEATGMSSSDITSGTPVTQ